MEELRFRLQTIDDAEFSKIPVQPRVCQPISACRDYLELQVLRKTLTSGGKPPRLTITTTIEGASKSIDVVLACVPAHTQPGDLLCHLAGDRTFTILRPHYKTLGAPDIVRCRFIGIAYVATQLLPVQNHRRVLEKKNNSSKHNPLYVGPVGQSYYLHDYKGPKFVSDAYHNFLKGLDKDVQVTYSRWRIVFEIE